MVRKRKKREAEDGFDQGSDETVVCEISTEQSVGVLGGEKKDEETLPIP